ncbi:DUF892 family protein [Cellvibrio mixtus]|uniref:DUF892 family protein n=1 Tax=Cellvibrio mixtus TaxID=39650 RepID=UPI0006935695|nr:DUF892 family protein [Cellvibrio mixtus]
MVNRLLSRRIEELGTSTSTLKNVAGTIVAAAQNVSGMVVSDEPVKGVLALHTFNQMAIGSYKILVCAAEAEQDLEAKQICQTIIISPRVPQHTSIIRWTKISWRINHSGVQTK